MLLNVSHRLCCVCVFFVCVFLNPELPLCPVLVVNIHSHEVVRASTSLMHLFVCCLRLSFSFSLFLSLSLSFVLDPALSQDYIGCAEVWIEFPCKHFGVGSWVKGSELCCHGSYDKYSRLWYTASPKRASFKFPS